MYIDVDTAMEKNLIGKVKVRLNGRKIKNAISAKSGGNGFVEFFDPNPKVKKDQTGFATKKLRGFVKISFDLSL